jgi:uncharacterized SAM-binding protein YcdF (DUF218 family)
VLFFLTLVSLFLAGDFAFKNRSRIRGAKAVAAGALLLALAAILGLTAPSAPIAGKVLGKLLMPIGFLWLVLGAAIAVLWVRRARALAGFGLAVWLVLTVAANPHLGQLAVASLESPYAGIDPFAEGEFDLVIVLGGGTASTPRGRAELGASGDRVMLGARLYHRGRTRYLGTSGSPIAGLAGEHDSVVATREIWRDLGVPDDAILEVQGARNTSEEAQGYAALLRERDFDRVGLVSSAAHLDRALARFEAEGVRVEPLPADFRAHPEWSGLYSLVPDGDGAANLSRAIWEWVGALAGR